MTSTNSASDLLKSFASLVFTVFVDTVGDVLVDLLCASASVEPVRLDLELMDAVQHCRDLIAFHVPNVAPNKMSPNSDMVAEPLVEAQFHSLSSLISQDAQRTRRMSQSPSRVAAATSIRVPGRRSAVQVVQVA